MTLAVPNCSNIPLVHSKFDPPKMNSKQSFLTIPVSFHVNQITIWKGCRYSSTYFYYLNTCRNYRTKHHHSVFLLPKIVTNTAWTHWPCSWEIQWYQWFVITQWSSNGNCPSVLIKFPNDSNPSQYPNNFSIPIANYLKSLTVVSITCQPFVKVSLS